MKHIKIWIATIVVAVFAVCAFTFFQVTTQPAKITTGVSANLDNYLVKGVSFKTTNVTVGNTAMTLYLQLIIPKGNLSNGIPFLSEVDAFLTFNSGKTTSVMVRTSMDNLYMNHTSVNIKYDRNTVLNGTILQSIYNSVSINQPISTSTQFNSTVSINFYSNIGPYYSLSKTVTVQLNQ